MQLCLNNRLLHIPQGGEKPIRIPRYLTEDVPNGRQAESGGPICLESVRFGRAARQLHPHQPTFAGSPLGPMLSTSDRFLLFGNNREWAGRESSRRSERR
jgi:hypothetical protein